MKSINFFAVMFIFSQLLVNQLYSGDKNKALPQGVNYIQEAQDFIKNNKITENDAVVLGQDISNFFEFLKKSGASLGEFGKRLQNKAALDALSTNLKRELDKMQVPLGNFLIQLQAYYTALAEDLNKKGKKDALKPLSLQSK